MNVYVCREHAPTTPGVAVPHRCGRPLDHPGVHVAYDGRREVDTWPRFEDVLALKRENGTL